MLRDEVKKQKAAGERLELKVGGVSVLWTDTICRNSERMER